MTEPRGSSAPSGRRNQIVAIVAVLLVAAATKLKDRLGLDDLLGGKPAAESVERPSGGGPADASDAIDVLFRERRSEVWVEGSGVVDRLLSDDDDGSRHQQFIVRVPSGLTLKFAHNIDLAERVPLSSGDRVSFRGLYEYNEKGGVVHWTHRDPNGRKAGGWIDWNGRRYE